MAEDKPKKSWLAKIKPKEDTLIKAIKDTSIAFLFAVGIYAVGGAFLVPAFITYAVSIAVPAFILIRWRSRGVAVLLLILVSIKTINTFLSKVGVISDVLIMFLVPIALWAGVRATEATFKLHGKFSKESASQPVPRNRLRRRVSKFKSIGQLIWSRKHPRRGA